MTHVTCRLSAKNRDQLRNRTLGNRVWATFYFFTVCRLEETGVVYDESAALAEAAVSKARQAYTDTLQTLTDAESLGPATAANLTDIRAAAADITHQVEC